MVLNHHVRGPSQAIDIQCVLSDYTHHVRLERRLLWVILLEIFAALNDAKDAGHFLANDYIKNLQKYQILNKELTMF